MEWYFDQYALWQLLEIPPYTNFYEMPCRMVEAFQVISEAIKWHISKQNKKESAASKREQDKIDRIKNKLGKNHGRRNR